MSTPVKHPLPVERLSPRRAQRSQSFYQNSPIIRCASAHQQLLPLNLYHTLAGGYAQTATPFLKFRNGCGARCRVAAARHPLSLPEGVDKQEFFIKPVYFHEYIRLTKNFVIADITFLIPPPFFQKGGGQEGVNHVFHVQRTSKMRRTLYTFLLQHPLIQAIDISQK